jgi:hypothetical protein
MKVPTEANTDLLTLGSLEVVVVRSLDSFICGHLCLCSFIRPSETYLFSCHTGEIVAMH